MNVFFEDLGLYKHVSILETLVLQAESEFQQENTLLDIIARWGKAGWKPEPPEARPQPAPAGASRAAQAKAERAMAAVAHLLPVLALEEPEVDNLRHDTVALQAIGKSKFPMFHEPALLWVARLEAIADALALAKTNRETSGFLYTLYTKSDEVRRAFFSPPPSFLPQATRVAR